MKQKASLLLMEQLVMILIFALAAALCLQVFARAEAISRETARRDEAVVLAQNAAELLKASGGDLSRLEVLSTDGYRITAEDLPAQPGMNCARIQVHFEERVLVSLDTGWQEVLP